MAVGTRPAAAGGAGSLARLVRGHLPPERALALLPLAFWRQHALLPLEVEPDGIVVLAGQTPSADVLTAIRRASGYPVRLVGGTPEEVLGWLDVREGVRDPADVDAESLAALLEDLGIRAARSGRLTIEPDGALRVAAVVEAFGLDEETACEVLALYHRLPRLHERGLAVAASMAEVLPRADAEMAAVVPLVARAGALVVATAAAPAAGTLRWLEGRLGLPVRLALCTPAVFTRLSDQVYGGQSATPPPATAPNEEDAVLARLRQSGALREVDHRDLTRVGSQDSRGILASALRLGYVQPRDVDAARARVLDLPLLEARDAAQVDEALARLGSPALWRRWRCVPIRRPGRATPALAVEGPLPATRASALRRLLLLPRDLERAYAPPALLESLLAHLPPPSPRPLDWVEYLVETGRLSTAHQTDLQRQANPPPEAASGLVRTRVLDVEHVAEAIGVPSGTPWVRLSRCAPTPAALQALPVEAAREHTVVPLRHRGMQTMVAALDAFAVPQPTALIPPLRVEPEVVLAAVDDPAQALDWWYGRGGSELPEAYDAFGRTLVARRLLTPGQLEATWVLLRRGGRLHEAVSAAAPGLDPGVLARTLADHAGLPLMDLEPRARQVPYMDALGRSRVETLWEDPVERGLARLLPRVLAERHAAVPVRRVGERLEVAFADPLDPAAVAAVEEAVALPLRVVVATARAIDLAQRRVYASSSLGERLLLTGAITRDQLQRALEVHQRAGVRLGQALVNLGFITEDDLALTIAEQADVPFMDLRSASPDPEVARRIPRDMARARGMLPLFDDGLVVVVACTELPDPREWEDVAALVGRPVQPAVATESAFDDALNALYRDEYLDHSASHLVSRSPEDSARWVVTPPQKRVLLGTVAAIGIGAVLAPLPTATVLMCTATLFYVTFSLYKFYLAYRALTHSLEVDISPEEVAALTDHDLPIYTILVPVYRETEVFPILARAIERLDYPKAKLDVKILLEEDDRETIEVARRSRLPSHFKLVVVPHGMPKGKPKACNYGLIHARGEFVVIYDAEDIPEPDQLKKALLAFRKGSAQLACVQAKLNYFNRDQNMLTRWFTTEYSMWFDLFLPGLDASGAPIPLGGTSNHFRTDRLRELGAWDPYNVTEDADLGMRLYKAGWKTAVIDSTTYEEANSDVFNWIRQRSRWVKGYIQTYLVHMRHPVALWKAIGWKAFISFQLVVGGTFFGFLVNPIFWALTACWFIFKWAFIKEIFPPPYFYMGALGLYFGNFAFTYLNVAGCLRRQYYDMVKYALLSPIYWALMSIAAWKGFLQLFYKPFYWEKTQHGLSGANAHAQGLLGAARDDAA